MRNTLKNYFIPHEANDYNPHFFRNTCVIFLTIIVVATLCLSFIGSKILEKRDILGAVYASVLVDLANKDRDGSNLSTLSISPLLEQAAKLKAEDMAKKGYFAHTSPEGLSPWHWFSKTGYKFIYAGENLAVNFSESEAVEKAWMASPGHRANILSHNFNEIGIAVKEGVFQGRNTIFVVQMFGRPALIAYEPKKETMIATDAPKLSYAINPVRNPVISPATQALRVDNNVSNEIKGANADIETLEETGSEAGDDLFIAVKDQRYEEAVELVGDMTDPKPEVFSSSLFDRIALKYPKFIQVGYFGLAALVGIALMLLIFMEVRIQRPKAIALGLLLLLLIGISFYATTSTALFQLAALL